MESDDYFVVVYQILSYLYQCLKNGKEVKEEYFSKDSPLYPRLNEKYWRLVLESLYDNDLIVHNGATYYAYGIPYYNNHIAETKITEKGIKYLFTNSSLMEVNIFYERPHHMERTPIKFIW